ncbi:BON1-associated protein 1 [Bienertia sinuspersici]
MNASICSSYSLEINVKSAESLTLGKHKHISKNVFVTISAENQCYPTSMQTKLCDQDNKAKPTWNEKFLMSMSMNAKYLHFEVCYKKGSRDKLIGTAKVPTSDFVGNNMPVNYLHCLCYRLRDCNDEPNGIISFDVNVKGYKRSLDSQCNGNQDYREAIEIQGFGYKDNNQCGQKPRIGTKLSGRRNSTAVVVGVPAAWYNSCHA